MNLIKSWIQLIVIGLILCHSVYGYFESCDQLITLAANEQRTLTYPNYPNSYTAGSSCRYVVRAPTGYQVVLQCSLNIPSLPDGRCTSQYFYVGIDGNSTLYNSEYFCGSGDLTRFSLFTEMSIAYTSDKPQAGQFNCIVQSWKPPCDCGWSVNTRIVGGTPTGVNEFPSMVSIRVNGVHICGGTIIDNKYVVTAAHCVVPYNAGVITVVVGEHDNSVSNESPYRAVYQVLQKIVNLNYNPSNGYNDIALLRVPDIKYSRGVGPACLPFFYSQADFTGQYVTAIGWGSTSFGGPYSNVLRKTSLQVLSNAQCASSLGVSSVDASIMCTYAQGRDSCQQDSGGPQIWNYGRQFLLGIITSGAGCATTRPGQNTRITSYISWIQTNAIGAELCQKA